jgi:hypothetical protein
VFENVEEAIFLEDDCVPHPTFFRFCQELLTHYRDDERIMLISGNSFQPQKPRTEYSYYFSRLPYTWGWASWRRTWRHYDMTISLWPQIRDGHWDRDLFGSSQRVRYWRKIFNRVAKQDWDVWDYQLFFSLFINNGLTIAPRVNLVSNIGFGADATHTMGKCAVTDVPAEPVEFPLRHPPFIIPDRRAERIMSKLVFRGQSAFQRTTLRSKALIRRVIGDSIYTRLKHRFRPETRT